MGKGRAPCCDKSQVKKGPWSPTEDIRLITFIQQHGHQNWRALPKQAGLLRCGKSCRLRWINYLRPDLRRGNFTKEEEDMIIKLHKTLGNKWSKIAAHLPGRTDNEIKNVWNTHFKKRLALMDANPESSSSTSSSSLSSSISVSGGNTSMGTELDDQRNQVFKSKRTKNCVKPKESSNSAMSSDMSNVTNSDQVDVTEQDKAEVQDMTLEVPLESDIDFWNMLDGLSNSDNDVPALDNVEESRSSNFGDTYLEEIENKRWLRYLETELGLEETPDDGNQENLPGDATEPEIPGDSMYDSSLLDPETDSELGYYHLWPSSLSITYK